MSDDQCREHYDAVMAVLGKLDVNHPARLAFSALCDEYVNVLALVEGNQ